jgi:hypothetical protein
VLLGGDTEDENLVALAGLLSGALVVFKICDITLWLSRLSAFLICDTAPAAGARGAHGLPGDRLGRRRAMIGTIVGTAVAGVVGLILLTGSYQRSFDIPEIWEIIKRGGYRAPIVMSFWLIQNADIFILSRFVGHEELGVYHLASRLGFVVSFLPQGFRMGMRPMRKSAAYDAFTRVYYEFGSSELSPLAGSELATLPNLPPIGPGTDRYRLELGRALIPLTALFRGPACTGP